MTTFKSVSEDNILCDKYQAEKAERYWVLLGKPDFMGCNASEQNRRRITTDDYGAFKGYDKAYIKIGDECPICYEPMMNAKNSYYTDCGHKMHKTCITSWYDAHNNSTSGCWCPLCIQDMGMCDWLVEGMINHKYDNLELFKDYIDRQQCTYCHYYIGNGRKMGCNSCKLWAYTQVDYQHPKQYRGLLELVEKRRRREAGMREIQEFFSR